MHTIGSLLRSLFPAGVTDIKVLLSPDLQPQAPQPLSDHWMPLWPPDLFGACASLIEHTGAYASPGFFEDNKLFQFNSPKQCDRIRKTAALWNKSLWETARPEIRRSWTIDERRAPYKELFRQWRIIVCAMDDPFGRQTPAALFRWQAAAMTLMAICDEACASVGFSRRHPAAPPTGRSHAPATYAQYLMTAEQWNIQDNDAARRAGRRPASGSFEGGQRSDAGESGTPESRSISFLKERGVIIAKPFMSLCIDLPVDVACVLPKTSTPSLGCSLRSLTHHLALLPGIGRVATYWIPRASRGPQHGSLAALNLLMVPYPFEISGKSFYGFPHDATTARGAGRFFGIHQTWVRSSRNDSDEWVRQLFRFIDSLIGEAQREVDFVHGVVLPELSLPETVARELAEKLADVRGVEFFIAGVTRNPDPPQILSRHGVYSAFFSQNKIMLSYFQGKHHRWKLDRFQIARYHLGDKLDPKDNWWEALDVSDRSCHFYPFRDHMCLTTLVCEDLARAEPVQPVIRAVGPNLMIVLLMDGPQLDRRWPSKYATIYADDPGTSVLTLTCRGMVKRSTPPGANVPTQIALWRDSTNPDSTELHLPLDCHALLLSLSPTSISQTSLDGRTIDGAPKRLCLTGTFAVRTNVPLP